MPDCRSALHIAPHPDDEVIGAPAHLMALRDSGWQIINFAVSLGRPADRQRRLGELNEACQRAKFELLVPADPYLISAGDDRAASEARLARELADLLLSRPEIALVVSPSPHDGHHGHEVVGRAARRALDLSVAAGRAVPDWWMWGLWADLPMPSQICLFEQARADEILYALAAHVGELERNDYRDLVTGRGLANRCLAAERVFGFGAPALTGTYAELVMAVRRSDSGGWKLLAPRVLEEDGDGLRLASPQYPEAGPDVTWWLDLVSVRDRLAAQG